MAWISVQLSFIVMVKRMKEVYVENLHIEKLEICNTIASCPSPSPSVATAGLSLSNSQLVLAFHYVLLSWGVQPRITIDIAPIARFMHLVSGKPYKRIHTSEFYKKLQRVPNFKNDKELIKDLTVVKRLLLEVELKEASLLVDREINLASQEIRSK
jgi:hypothetical protein